MPSKPAPCPQCGVTMRAVTARATTGYLILLDQCDRCGGVWCDRWELYPLDAAEAARLDAVDNRRLQEPTPHSGPPGHCPRCTTALRPFRDPLLPADLLIERCTVCDGMWCNRGALAGAKRKGRAKPARVDLSQLTRTLKRADPPPAPTAITNLDAATYAADAAPASAEWRDWLRGAGPWLALFALLKLLLR